MGGGKEAGIPGNAKEAISILPTKVNVAVAASLATTGAGGYPREYIQRARHGWG